MREGPWELCEVRLTLRTTWRMSVTLEAVATGAYGQKVIATRRFHHWMSATALDQDPTMERKRASLVTALVRDGWEPRASVVDRQGVMLPRFRRRARGLDWPALEWC